MKLKKFKFIGYIICITFVFTFNSCKKHNTLNERERNLFAQTYHGHPVPLDSIKILDDLLSYLEKSYCVDYIEPWPILYLDMKTQELVKKPNKNTLTIGIEACLCGQIQGNYDATMILEIIKDGYNTFIEQEFAEVTDIPKYINKQMLSNGSDKNYAAGAYGNGIWLCTKKEDEFKNLNKYIYQIVNGFIKSARDYSLNNFGKEISELSEKEYKILTAEFNFRLSFKYTNKDPVFDLGY